MTSIFLILLTICSFLFYGVVGADKYLLLGPIFVCSYIAISMALLKKAWGLGRRSGDPSSSSTSNFQLPTASILWMTFLLWGIAMIPGSLMTYEAKIRMLFFGAVIGSYIVWGHELTAFKDNRLVLGGLIFVVMLLALYGLIVHFKCPDQVLWAERYVSYVGRLMSTYICPNHFAHLMQMVLPFCLALLFIPQSGIYLKILAGYSFLVMLPPIFLTESRASWLGSIAAIGVVVCLMALRRSKKLFMGLVILVPLCSILLLLGAWRYSETFQRRALPVVSFLKQQSEDGVGSEARDFRPQTWMDTIDLIKASPLFGHGPGNYRYAYPEFRKRFRGQRIVTGHPHNEYLELTAEFGLIGLGLFALAWLYGGTWILRKSLKAEESRHAFVGFAFIGAMAGTMVHSFFDFQMHVFPNAMVFALLAALAVGPLRALQSRRSEGEKCKNLRAEGGRRITDNSGLKSEGNGLSEAGSHRTAPITQNLKLKAVFSWLLVLGYLLLAISSVPVMASAMLNALGDRSLTQMPRTVHSDAKTESLYRSSIKFSPDNWRAYRGMGRLLYDERRHGLDLEEKVSLAEREAKWFEKALAHNSKDPESLMALGRTLLFLAKHEGLTSSSGPNDFESAGFELLREACSYRKFNDQYWWILGVELRKAGKYEEALDMFRTMETIKRTKSSRKNIQWLEKQLVKAPLGNVSSKRDDDGPVELPAKDFMNKLDADGPVPSSSLENLFKMMEP